MGKRERKRRSKQRKRVRRSSVRCVVCGRLHARQLHPPYRVNTAQRKHDAKNYFHDPKTEPHKVWICSTPRRCREVFETVQLLTPMNKYEAMKQSVSAATKAATKSLTFNETGRQQNGAFMKELERWMKS